MIHEIKSRAVSTGDEKLGELEEMLCDRVRAFVRRSQSRIHDECDFAELSITLMQFFGDDDTPGLEARIEEKITVAPFQGRVSKPTIGDGSEV